MPRLLHRFEDDEGSVVGRLLTLGVDSAAIADLFHYIRPEHPLQGGHFDALCEELAAYGPSLALLDGITEAMNMHGLKPNDNVDISTFNRRVNMPLSASGAAQVSFDHVTKDREGRETNLNAQANRRVACRETAELRGERFGVWGGRDRTRRLRQRRYGTDQGGKNHLLRSNGLATYRHHRLLTLLTPHQLMLHQLILCSAAFFPPVAFDCLRLPPACCVADHGHCDVEEEAEAEQRCGHDVPFPIAALGVLSAQR